MASDGTKRIFSIGIDPGISGGALVVINRRSEIVATRCLAAKTLIQSSVKCAATLRALAVEWKPLKNYTDVIVGIEDSPLYAKTAEKGKGTQLKNIGAMTACAASIFWSWSNEGEQIHLVDPQKWKGELGLSFKKMQDETDYQFRIRKKQASKDFAIKLLTDAGNDVNARQISYQRHDFAEAFLIARHVLNLSKS